MKAWVIILLGVILCLLSACQPETTKCQWEQGTPRYITELPEGSALPPTTPLASTPVSMEIGNQTVNVDQVVDGPLCNGTWSGTVYVTCNVQVYAWQEEPTFLKNCDLSIAPGTIVYVAYHNDTAYYNGCSCHTGEIAAP